MYNIAMGDQCRKTETYFHHVSEMDGESTCACAFCTAISLRVEFTCCLSVYLRGPGKPVFRILAMVAFSVIAIT